LRSASPVGRANGAAEAVPSSSRLRFAVPLLGFFIVCSFCAGLARLRVGFTEILVLGVVKYAGVGRTAAFLRKGTGGGGGRAARGTLEVVVAVGGKGLCMAKFKLIGGGGGYDI